MERGVGGRGRAGWTSASARARIGERRRRATVLVIGLLDVVVLVAGVAAHSRVDATHAGVDVALPLERAQVLTLAAQPAAATLPAPSIPLSAPEPAPARVIPAAAPVRAPAASRPVGSLQERGDAALGLIRYPWRELGATVVFLPGRAGLLGKTFPERSRIEMYVRPGESALRLAYMTAHEIGHMVDWRYGTGPRRSAWKQLRGVPAAVPWFGSALGGGDDLSTLAGDFAETFAFWQVGPVDYASRVGPPPDAALLERMAALFAR